MLEVGPVQDRSHPPDLRIQPLPVLARAAGSPADHSYLWFISLFYATLFSMHIWLYILSTALCPRQLVLPSIFVLVLLWTLEYITQPAHRHIVIIYIIIRFKSLNCIVEPVLVPDANKYRQILAHLINWDCTRSIFSLVFGSLVRKWKSWLSYGAAVSDGLWRQWWRLCGAVTLDLSVFSVRFNVETSGHRQRNGERESSIHWFLFIYSFCIDRE